MNTSLRDSSRYNLWLVLILIAGLYLATNFGLPLITNATLGVYVLQPVMWLLLALVIFTLPRYRVDAKRRIKQNIILLAIVIGAFQVLLYVVGGLFSGFGRSPYSFTLQGIATNLFLVGSMLVGMELSRAWLANRLRRHHAFLTIIFVTFLYTLISLPLSQITSLSLTAESAAFLNSRFFPLLSENLLATVLVLLAGPLAAMAYRGVMLGFWWFIPVLPNLSWIFAGLVGTLVPILSLLIVRSYYQTQTQHGRARRYQEKPMAGWIIISIISVAIVWFSVGLFPIQPTLVASGSMRPVIDVGDVIIISKVSPDSIITGDVIQFRTQGDYPVIHRVIGIVETEGSKLFITKGDANNRPDADPVLPGNVVGKAVFTVPKIGWVAIWIKGFFTG